MEEVMEWKAMLLLGAFHGINPGMGWLFAVALGMQQGSARGVWRALPPIALGHAIAVGAVLVAAELSLRVLSMGAFNLVVAAILLGFGVYRLWRHRHPRFGGMQVGFRDLTVWSALMASAHGAGFMVLPFVLGSAQTTASASEAVCHSGPHNAVAAAPLNASTHTAHMAGISGDSNGALLLGLHTLAYLVVMALLAWVVYRKVGLALLRKAWLNLDWLWAFALVVTGAIVLFR
jgi:hypothetical protein